MNAHARKWLGRLVRIGISAGLVIWLFSRFDIKGVLASLRDLSIFVWVIASLIYVSAQTLSSIRWWVLSNTLGFPGKWRTYLGFYFVGMYFNLFLPTGVGGDVFKIHFLARNEGKRFLAACSVLGDRAFGLISLMLIGAISVQLYPDLLPTHFATFLSIAGLLIVCFMGGLPFLHGAIKIPWPRISQYMSGLHVLLKKPQRVLIALGLSFCLQILGIGMVALLARGIGIQVPPEYYFSVVPLITLMTLIPISFSGIGVREGAFVYFLGLKGIHPEPALTLGLVFFSVQVVASLLGGVAYSFGVHRRALA